MKIVHSGTIKVREYLQKSVDGESRRLWGWNGASRSEEPILQILCSSYGFFRRLMNFSFEFSESYGFVFG